MIARDQFKWDPRFLRMAREAASWSRDPNTKVGAVIVRPDKTIVSMGYNGFPRGVNDADVLYKNRDVKLQRVVHAELNAILTAREPLHGYSIYTWPVPPCAHCTAAIIQSGITHIVSIRPDPAFAERWKESFEHAEAMILQARISRTLHHASNLETKP